MSQTNRLWMEIYQIVKENCSSEYGGATPQGRCDGAAAVRSERKMSMTKYKTAESVRRGHPDKLCDLIADSILDECLRRDRYSRCACEVMVTKGKIFVCGEITCAAKINIRSVVREVLRKVGYVTPFWPAYRPKSLGDHYQTCDYSHEREWRIPHHFSFEYDQIEFVVLDTYEDMAKFPKELKDEIGRDKFLLMDNYRTIEKLWPVHIIDSQSSFINGENEPLGTK